MSGLKTICLRLFSASSLAAAGGLKPTNTGNKLSRRGRTRASYGIVASRVSNWAFQTKYPRQARPPGSGNNGEMGKKGGGKKGRSAIVQIRGLVLPSRLRLPKTMVRTTAAPKPLPASGASRRPASLRSPGLNIATKATSAPSRKRESSGQSQDERSLRNAAWEARFAMDDVSKFMTPISPRDIGGRFADVSPQTRTELERRIKATTFSSMGFRPEVLAAVLAMFGSDCKPTPVQALTIPASLDPSRNCRPLLVGAETGSGKTLAYVLPMINRLRQEEVDELKGMEFRGPEDVIEAVLTSQAIASKAGLDTEPSAIGRVLDSPEKGNESAYMMSLVSSSKVRRPRRPRGVILVPTRDLVDQVTRVIRSLCAHTAKLTVLGLHHSQKHRRSSLKRMSVTPTDILVTTPAAFVAQLNANGVERLHPTHISELVIDEADTLLDPSFHAELEECLDKIKTNPVTTLVSATFPVAMVKKISARYPNHVRVTTPKLHHTPQELKQSFVQVSGSDTKVSLITDLLRMASIAGDSRVLIFCNRRGTVEWLGEYLRSKYASTQKVGIITAGTDMREREAAVELFSGPRVRVQFGEDGNDGHLHVLVATDVASRGLDLTAVDHVVNYDFPLTVMEYLHRVGRTARNGTKGRATSFIDKKSYDLAAKIEAATRKRTVLA